MWAAGCFDVPECQSLYAQLTYCSLSSNDNLSPDTKMAVRSFPVNIWEIITHRGTFHGSMWFCVYIHTHTGERVNTDVTQCCRCASGGQHAYATQRPLRNMPLSMNRGTTHCLRRSHIKPQCIHSERKERYIGFKDFIIVMSKCVCLCASERACKMGGCRDCLML